MDYEVELKFRADDAADPEARISELGGEFVKTVEQRDTYFTHPVRDFSRTDEAFRVRSEGEHNCLTYKGPKLDRETKTRQELEVGIAGGEDARANMSEMLLSLGFREVATVSKRRRYWRLNWEGWEVLVGLDMVEHLGHFLELETLAGEAEWPSARESLKKLADHLELRDPERRSYLELLLANGSEETNG